MDFGKLIWSVLGTVALAIQEGLSDNAFTLVEQIALGALVLGTIGTWLVPNTTILKTAKTWVNAIGTGVALLATLAGDGLVAQEWLTVVILILTTAGVYAVPKAPLWVTSRPTRQVV